MIRELLAVAFLAMIPVVAIVWAAVWIRRSPYTVPQAILLFLAILLARLLWGAQIPRRLPLANHGGAIIVANHRSSVDPFFIQIVAGRPVHWMVAREYCEHPAFAWFLRTCVVIPVGRGGIDTAATKQAIRYVTQGEPIGMLPEGRINVTDEFMLPARPGAAMIALKAGVPIIPCYIEGSPYGGEAWTPLVMPARVRVRFGQPLPPPAAEEGETDERRAARFMLQALAKIAQLAGRDDFQPTLAGRKWKPTEQELDADLAASRRRARR